MLKGALNQFRNTPTKFSFNQQSNVETNYLKIKLDPVSGKLFGVVKQGPHAGKNLHELSLQELITLLKEYTQIDSESAQLLAAYLDRSEHTNWRNHYQQEDSYHRRANTNNLNMDAQEAHAILGLREGATKEEILEAHRRLIQKLHPDRGGNDYLASKINQAKSLLLK